MIRKGIKFRRAPHVIMLRDEVAELLHGDRSYVAVGRAVSYTQWQLGDKVPTGAFRMMLNIPQHWIGKWDGSEKMLWPVKIIPCGGHSRTNMMYGFKRIFWVEDARCYSTKLPMIHRTPDAVAVLKHEQKIARAKAVEVAKIMEARHDNG